jgi:uncharacterized protein YyaL (SSP411 family)
LMEWDVRTRRRLKEVRDSRPRPARDDKVLTDWNGLMIAALCLAHRYLGSERALDMAKGALGFLEGHMMKDGELYHSYRQGEVGTLSYLDDHAFLAWAYLEMYQLTLQPRHLEKALGLMERTISLFTDWEDGGFYLSREDPHLLMRIKDLYDGAMPSGNSGAYYVLTCLSALFKDARYVEVMEGLEKHFMRELLVSPSAHSMFMCGVLMKEESRTLEVFGGGDPSIEGYHPHLLLIRAEHMEKGAISSRTFYRLCLKGRCLPETEDLTEVMRSLQ